MNRRDLLRAAACSSGLLAGRFMSAQGGGLTLKPLSDGFHVLMGAGGNITVLNTKDGWLVVDSGLAIAADQVLEKLKSVSGAPVKTLINTHWHADHTGGNVGFGKSGTEIVAQVNTLKRVSVKQHMVFFNRDIEPLAAEGLPKKTFTVYYKLGFGGETLQLAYHPPAHTDGDITVHFVNANILSMGDLMFSGMYPFIDYSSGGSIEGMIGNAESILRMVDEQTTLVPGHGPVSKRADLKALHDMMVEVNEPVSKLVAQGKSVEEVLAAGPTKKFDAQWGNGILKPDAFVKMLYQGKMQAVSKAA